jgi:ectoine hydroxylase-related dioxygenase (phytanoyl-CoA dioxygenase family)
VAVVPDDHLRSVASMVGILAANLLRSPVSLFGATYVVKDDLPALWHQDGGPWVERLGGRPAITAWLGLDPSTRASGCLRVLPGSHAGGLLPLVPTSSPPNLFGVTLDSPVDGSSAVDLELGPGDVSFHDPALIHSSGPNTSGSPRRALVLRFAASD